MNLALSGRLEGPGRSNNTDVVDQLGIAIVAGEYPEDTLIPLDPDLEEMFGVSRTVIREAKKTLVAKGLLQSKAKVGTRVRPSADWNMFDSDVLNWHASIRRRSGFINDLFEIRLILEPEAAALVAAAPHRPEPVRTLRRLHGELAQAASSREFLTLDLEFHRAILRASENCFMRSLGDLVEVAYRVLMDRHPAEGGTGRSLSAPLEIMTGHGALIAALSGADSAGARSAMTGIIQIVREKFSA